LVPGGDRAEALRAVFDATGARDDGKTLLSDSRSGVARFDAAEDRAFAAWSGPRESVRKTLGESFGASSGLQVVAAVERIRAGRAARALVTTLGGNEQAGGCLIG
jgi:hypothetical protein